VISAIVLAAGESKRMGSMQKALLPVSGSTFLEKIVKDLRHTESGELIVVLGAESEKVLESTDLRMARVVVNEEWETGQLSSLRAGIRKCSSESEKVLFTLVDHPLVKESTYDAIIRLWKKNRDMIVIPTYNGRRGHPTLFPRALYRKLLNDPLLDGARGLFRKGESPILQTEVDDPGILIDIDTEYDYKRYIGEL
jgi:molybdenum cofactor cytidylyltransferase